MIIFLSKLTACHLFGTRAGCVCLGVSIGWDSGFRPKSAAKFRQSNDANFWMSKDVLWNMSWISASSMLLSYYELLLAVPEAIFVGLIHTIHLMNFFEAIFGHGLRDMEPPYFLHISIHFMYHFLAQALFAPLFLRVSTVNVSSNGCARRYLYLAVTFGRTRSPWLLQLPSWKAAHARDSTHVSGRQLCDLGCQNYFILYHEP